MSKREDQAVVTDLHQLVKKEVALEIDGYRKDNKKEHQTTRAAFASLEKVVIDNNGGAGSQIHNFLQDVAIAVIMFFTFTRS